MNDATTSEIEMYALNYNVLHAMNLNALNCLSEETGSTTAGRKKQDDCIHERAQCVSLCYDINAIKYQCPDCDLLFVKKVGK